MAMKPKFGAVMIGIMDGETVIVAPYSEGRFSEGEPGSVHKIFRNSVLIAGFLTSDYGVFGWNAFIF